MPKTHLNRWIVVGLNLIAAWRCAPASGLEWPEAWHAFGPVPPPAAMEAEGTPSRAALLPGSSLEAIPEALEIGGQRYEARTVSPDRAGQLDLAALFGGAARGRTAYLLAPVKAAQDVIVRIGAGADWWMQWWVDGAPVFNTLDKGNGKPGVAADNHSFEVRLSQGEHVLAAAVISGIGGFRLAAAPLEIRAARRPFTGLRLPEVFGDHMVLQSGRPVPVWGWAEAGESVTVSFGGQTRTAAAGADGTWRVTLDSLQPSKAPAELTVRGGNRELVVRDVLVGEVWLCSGQSNMQMLMRKLTNAASDVAEAAHFPHIRHFKAPWVSSFTPLTDTDGGAWLVCATNTVGTFTATGYFFARDLARALDVPVGLLNCSWGGTPIEAWTPLEGFKRQPEFKDIVARIESGDMPTDAVRNRNSQYIEHIKAWVPEAYQALQAGEALPAVPALPARGVADKGTAAGLFNGMIRPLVPFALHGAVWYQGAANHGKGYRDKLKALIGGWRLLWGQGDFPVYIVQEPNFQRSDTNTPAGSYGWTLLREAQLQAFRAIPNTGLIVIIDLGDPDQSHPHNKQDVGARLARWALANEFQRDLPYCGPLYREHAIEGGKVRIRFDYAGSGLMVGAKHGLEPVRAVPGGTLQWFAVAGKDRAWHWAEAVIEGSEVVVSSPAVPEPAAVRYAFSEGPIGGLLYNKDGLPASPFRTDDW